MRESLEFFSRFDMQNRAQNLARTAAKPLMTQRSCHGKFT